MNKIEKQFKAVRYRLYPNNEQAKLITKTFGCVRFIYNKMLNDKINHYEKTGESLKTNPATYKTEFPWLKEVDSLSLCSAWSNLETAYNRFFRKLSDKPVYKSKHKDKRAYTTNNQKGTVALLDKHIKLPKLGLVKYKKHRELPLSSKVKSATISQHSSGNFYISVMYEYEVEEIKPIAVEKVIGLDFSMRELYVSSDNEKAEYPRYYRQSQIKLAKLQRKLSKKTKQGKNYLKLKAVIAKLHEHIANQRKDFLHKKSREITNLYDLVGIETLSMKGMSKALNFGKSVHDNGWYMFTNFLDYKLKELGKHLIKIDRFFPSSKTCNACGTIKAELSLSERVYVCDCGNILDRDINASINIKNEAIRLYEISLV